MYKRLAILSVLIVSALGALTWLGYHSIGIWAQGMEGTRIGEFAEVAEQIQQDVERKFDAFMEQEQKRPYTDYQYYYVPESAIASQPMQQQQAAPIVRSPLAGKLEHGLAYYNFQIEPGGNIMTPNGYIDNEQQETQQTVAADAKLYNEIWLNTKNVEDNLLPILTDRADSFKAASAEGNEIKEQVKAEEVLSKAKAVSVGKKPVEASEEFVKGGKGGADRVSNLAIESFQKQDQASQVIRQSRALVASNELQNTSQQGQMYMQQQMAEPQVNEVRDSQYEEMMMQQPEPQIRRDPNQRVNSELSAGDAGQQLQGMGGSRSGMYRLNSQSDSNVPPPQVVAPQSSGAQAKAELEKKLAEVLERFEARQAEYARAKKDERQAKSQGQLEKEIEKLRTELTTISQNTQRLESLDTETPASRQRTTDRMQGTRRNMAEAQPNLQRDRTQRPEAQTTAQTDMYGREPAQWPPPPDVQMAQTEDFSRVQQDAFGQQQADTVEIRIEPFEPVLAPSKDAKDSIFGGQVFMLRKVHIEDKTLRQGFLLNQKKLVEEIEESAQRLVREGMSFGLGKEVQKQCAYTAVLDFGFGHLLLNLIEADPDCMLKRIGQLKNVYFGIISVVMLAVTLALGALWQSQAAQLRLAQKKDDFLSAVSHELRTPLTSIRMYSEMLEKNWVKSKEKVGEYYKNMRQESERLSRLIENVLDFSRIQRGRKRYSFKVGEVNECVGNVIEMMKPYAGQHGFEIDSELGDVQAARFDSDAVTQIVVNLVDNAIKYAREAEDKKVIVRTRTDNGYVLIEVEDHGPGVPHRQRKKVFEEFYRIGAEATRETTGTGLGLALVKRFAEAHDGFVQILNAKPTGAIFRVGLAAET